MIKIYPLRFYFSFLLFALMMVYGCSKGGSGSSNPGGNPCAGITVIVNGTVTNPSTPIATDGSISVSATGGSGFTYSLNGGAFQASASFTGLGAGSYTVTAKNSNGCTGTGTFTLTAPNPCAGVTIVVSGTVTNPTSQTSANGSIAATATGSTGFTFSLNGGAFQASGTFTGLLPGSYTVTAKDLNGCTGTAVFTLTAPNPCSGITIIVSGTVTNPSVSGGSDGSIAATATGSTGFTFSLNGGAFQASGTFTNLTAGNYTVTAKDLNGCTGSANFVLTDPNPCNGITIIITPTVVNNTPCASPPTGSITVTASGGTPPYTYRLNTGSFQTSNVFSNLIAGTYSITAKDANGCSNSLNVNVTDLPAGPLFTQVKTLLQNNCVVCHNSGNPNGGMDWTVDCNIVTFQDRIKARAVDGIPSPMPPTGLLPASERQKITNWINAGGKYTN